MTNVPVQPAADGGMGPIDQLLERNKRFAERDYQRLPLAPRLRTCIVTCPDPRVDPAQVLGLELGDAAVVRAAGGRISPIVLQQLIFLAQTATAGGQSQDDLELILMQHTERSEHVLLMGLNRPAKRNAFTTDTLQQLGRAYFELESDEELRCGVLFAHGKHFTGGLDLADVLPQIVDGERDWARDELNPLGTTGPMRTTPVVIAAHGWCLTIGIELLLAADVCVASRDTRFAQVEIQRGIFPLGGATFRLPRVAGWGNAMRWLLTGDEFDAAQAMCLGLIQEIVEPGAQSERECKPIPKDGRSAAGPNEATDPSFEASTRYLRSPLSNAPHHRYRDQPRRLWLRRTTLS